MLQFGDMKGVGYFAQVSLQGLKYMLRVLSKKVRQREATECQTVVCIHVNQYYHVVPFFTFIHISLLHAQWQDSASHGNTALVFHAQKLLALEEGGLPYQLRTACSALLDTIGRVSFGGKLQHAFTAHPKVDAASQYMFSFGYSVDSKPYCMRSVFDPAGMSPACCRMALLP